MKRLCLAAMAATLPLCAQTIDYSFLDKLAEKAKQSAVIDMGAEQLALLSGLKPKGVPSGADELTKNLKALQVRSYEFDAPGQYDIEQVRAFRDKVKSEGHWVSLVAVKEKDGFTDIMVKKGADGKPAGLLIIAAEPKELSVVHIDGPLDLSALRGLQGIPGIPEIGAPQKKSGQPAPREKEE